MKKIAILIILILSFFTYNSCELEEVIYDTATPESALLNESDIYHAVVASYATINGTDGFGRNAMWLMFPSGEDLSSTSGNATGQWAKRVTVNSGFGLNDALWSNLYQGVSRANALLGYLENMELDETFEAEITSEALFLRAFFHFCLVQLYGDVPLITEVIDASSDFYTSRNSVDEVYTQIFEDLQGAIENLTPKGEQLTEDLGRATKETAQGYLARTSLFYANYLDLNGRSGESSPYYQQAVDYANMVLQSPSYGLVEDYAQLWDVNFEVQNAKEILFACINTRDPVDTGNGGEGAPHVRFFVPKDYPDATGNNNGRGNEILKVQPWFFERYTKGDYEGDYRTEVSFIYDYDTHQGKHSVSYPFTPTNVAKSQAYIKKYIDGEATEGNNHENDFPLLRLSDVYLMKAEALNELNGPTADALAAFNAVRARARLADGNPRTNPVDIQPGLTKEEFRMKIFDERGLEFVAEYNRFFDLTRMRAADNQRTMYEYQYDEFLPGLTPGLPKWKNGKWTGGVTEASNIIPYDPKWLLFPIPSNQREKNPNLTQNPGW